MTEAERVEEIRARHQAATPGPWVWRGNTSAKQIDLQTYDRGGIYVMSFRRWGTQSAMPWFQSVPAGLIRPALEYAYRPQSHNPWLITDINHPDAQVIAHAPADVAFLLERLGQVERERDALEGELDRVRALGAARCSA